jgi:CBS domain containing-hemolysin-like protein
MTIFIESPLLPLLFLFGSLTLTACSTSMIRLGKFKSKELLKAPGPLLFYVRPLLKRILRKHEWENLYFSISISKQIFMLAYATSSFFYLISTVPSLYASLHESVVLHHWLPLVMAGLGIIAVLVVLDFGVRIAANLFARQLLLLAAPIGSLYLLILSPLIALFLLFFRDIVRKIHLDEDTVMTDKTRLSEMIRESELQPHLDPADQKLISSFLSFKERVAKEIMVPRVDLFALPRTTPLREAASLFAHEGYSRIPIFEENLDQITGVVLYKDLLKTYTATGADVSAPLQTIAKPVLYAPENKKISHLLQEFRTKQIHMAIVVDEYGGTEGIVTIEDILEELVGEIEDEYDIGDDHDFLEMPSGGWIVDAKMSILNIHEQLGISIPESPEYETIGGYIFHCAGTIPGKGWRLSHDNFDLEILSSDERSIKKIKITPRRQSDNF